jgi:hypothetical protein
VAATSPVGVYADMETAGPLTSCGIPIKVVRDDKARYATLGGIVMVTGLGRNHFLFGMTAGHAMLDKEDDEDPEKLKDEDDTGSEGDGYLLEEDNYFELDIATVGEQYITPIGSPEATRQRVDQGEQNDVQWSPIGHISATSHDNPEEEPDLDWALIELDESLHRPNLFVDPKENPHEGDPFLLVAAGDPPSHDRRVVVFTGTSGYRTGTLLKQTSYLMMSPGKRFVETGILNLDDQNGNHHTQASYLLF